LRNEPSIWPWTRKLSMNEVPPAFRDQRKIDAGHLNLLAIFHFVGAGLALLGILFLIAHYSILHFVFNNPKMWQNQKQALPRGVIFASPKLLYLFFAVWFLSSAILNVLSGFFLRARKYRTFSLVVAGINCLHMPVGTVLGVFTIIFLIRDSVGNL